jgi:DNA sulfur modification protein DndB
LTNDVIVFNQFWKNVIFTQMGFGTLRALCEMNLPLYWEIDKDTVIAERDWFLAHVENKSRISLAPFTFSARNCEIVNKENWALHPNGKLVILTGQEKIMGLAAAVQFLQDKKDYAIKEKKPRMVKQVEQALERLTTIPIFMQIYFDLSIEEERMLYEVFHSERRCVHAGVRMQYDQRCEFAVLTRRVAERIEECMEIEQKLSRMMDQSTALTSLSIMHKCTLALWEGDLGGKTVKASNTLLPTATLEKRTEEFYKVWLELFPDRAWNRQEYVSGLAGIQIALAYTVFLLTKEHKLSHRKAIQKLRILKSTCTWSHHDPLFTHLFDLTTGRIKNHSKKCYIQKTARKFLLKITEEVQ